MSSRFIRTLAASAVLAGASGAAMAAGGPLDGVYQCAVAGTGVFVTVSGQPSGPSMFTIAALGPANSLYGYGMGTATASSFTGTTSFNLPFTLSVSQGNLIGSMGVLQGTTAAQLPVNCAKLF
ncbi:hypothetical protein LJR066_005010 [Acidovorax sp. LjRoot66]|uniref:hypothetical protein n=1 Tax=Acidovorax sp. LjRoot66 TaxID=3342334 RepID=UPI003ED04EBF